MGETALETGQMLTLIGHDNQRAFDMFYHLYYGQVFRTAYYFVKETEACREVVSNVFFAIWKSRKTLRDILNMDAYLFVTTRREALHYLSRQAREGDGHPTLSLSEETAVQLELAATEESPESSLISSELEASLSRIVDELPEKCRIIFLMSREEGMASKEIANRLDISESTVRVQLKLAVEKITARLRTLYPHLTFSLLLAYLLG